MRIRDVLTGGLLVVLGFVAGNLDSLQAQQQIEVVDRSQGPWELYHGFFGDDNDYAYYVIRFNPSTGDALVMDTKGQAEGETWFSLPFEDKSGVVTSQ